MDKNKKLADIIKLLSTYMDVYPNKLSERGLVRYAQVLEPLPLAAIEAAMVKVAQTKKFWPTPAEIFAAAEEVSRFYLEETTGEHTPTAAEAWAEVQLLVKRCGMYQPWEYSCQEVEQAAEQFGRYELCMLEMDAVNTARAQFMRIYESVFRRSRDKLENQRALRCMNPQSLALLAESIAEVKQIGY